MEVYLIYWLCQIVFLAKGTLPAFLDNASDSDINAVRIRLSEEKAKRLLLQNDIETLMLKIEKMERKLNEKPFLDEKEDINTTSVYFNAKLTPHVTIDSQHVVVFDKIIENVGEGYSSSTGIFQSPFSGIYLFSLSILSKDNGQYAHIQVMRNNNVIGQVFAGSDTGGRPQTGCVTVTTRLAAGDEVYARELPGNTGHLHGYSFCSFSGVLLQRN